MNSTKIQVDFRSSSLLLQSRFHFLCREKQGVHFCYLVRVNAKSRVRKQQQEKNSAKKVFCYKKKLVYEVSISAILGPKVRKSIINDFYD